MALRPWSDIPRPVLLVLALALAAQLGWRAPASATAAPALAPAMPAALGRLASLGEPVALARLLMLYVQSAEGRQSFNQMDYAVLVDWLNLIATLDPRGQYPFMAASQVYAAASDPARTRLMLDFVHARFADDPDRRWPWLAHAALVARHRLHDLPLALRYAHEIRIRTTAARLPAWAQQLEVFMLEDMNEADSARALIGALLASGQVTDPRELAFLARRLEQLQAQQPQRR
jgi:hypothetical protein